MASSDQGVGFDLDNSIPSLLHLPYNVPVGMPNSVEAFCTEVCPVLIDSRAFSKSSGVHVVGAALKGAASLIPSLLAILYNVLLGIPENNSVYGINNSLDKWHGWQFWQVTFDKNDKTMIEFLKMDRT